MPRTEPTPARLTFSYSRLGCGGGPRLSDGSEAERYQHHICFEIFLGTLKGGILLEMLMLYPPLGVVFEMDDNCVINAADSSTAQLLAVAHGQSARTLHGF